MAQPPPYIYTYIVNIPSHDRSKLAQQAKLVQGARVVVISKFSGEEQHIDPQLLTRVTLVRCLYGPRKERIFLVKRKWLHQITDVCLSFTDSCPTCIRAISLGPIYLENSSYMPIIPSLIERQIHSDIGKKPTKPQLPRSEIGVSGLRAATRKPKSDNNLIRGGSGAASGNGGSITITGGTGGCTGNGGSITITGGTGGCTSGDFSSTDGTSELYFDASKDTLKMTDSNKKDNPIKKQKLILKQHQHANELLLEERKQQSRERIALGCAKYKMFSTAIRWLSAAVTAGCCTYFLI